MGNPDERAASFVGWRLFLMTLAAVLIAVSALGSVPSLTGRASSVSATTNFQVADPLDGWLGGISDLGGDLALARTVLSRDMSVTAAGGSLHFEARDASRSGAQLHLSEAVSAYDRARSDLREDLDERLDLLPGLAAFAEARALSLNREVAEIDAKLALGTDAKTSALRADRAAALASALDFGERRERIDGLLERTLAPVWSRAPINTRLELLDELLGSAFWFAAGEGLSPVT